MTYMTQTERDALNQFDAAMEQAEAARSAVILSTDATVEDRQAAKAAYNEAYRSAYAAYLQAGGKP